VSASFLAVGAHVALVEISDAIWMQIVVSLVGIALLTAVAYYRSWSKKADKRQRRRPGSAAENHANGCSALRPQALGSARFHARNEFVSLPPDLMGDAVLR